MRSASHPILIAGPTAAGKSELALKLAQTIDGEIIAVDSMQVYQGLDIGTAKPSLAERQLVPHHLIDVVTLAESFDAAQFVRLADAAVTDIERRGRVPILCGGTGLYFKAFLTGLGDGPPADARLRELLEATPLENLLQELAELDPPMYQKIDRRNLRRVVRAVEVIRLTGRPYSAQRASWEVAAPHAYCPKLSLGLARSRSNLHLRIDQRIDEMFARGLVAETEELLRQGLERNKTALQALGYRQVVEYLQGKRSLAETISLVKIRTRQFAKRQLTWFRKQLSLSWIMVSPEQSPDSVLEQIQKNYAGHIAGLLNKREAGFT